jgi:hypothetical protein
MSVVIKMPPVQIGDVQPISNRFHTAQVPRRAEDGIGRLPGRLSLWSLAKVDTMHWMKDRVRLSSQVIEERCDDATPTMRSHCCVFLFLRPRDASPEGGVLVRASGVTIEAVRGLT